MRLKILKPNGKTKTVELDPSTAIRLGSSKLADVVLAGPGIEQLHCGIMWHGEHFELLASRTAKTINYNGAPVASAMLRDGDRFKIGAYEITVVESPPTPSAAVPTAGQTVSPPAPTATDDEELTLAPLDDEPKPKPAAGKSPTAAAAKPPAPADDEELSLAPLDDEAKAKPPAPAATKPAPASAAGEDELALAPMDDEPKKKEPTAAAKPAAPPAAGRVEAEKRDEELALAPLEGDATAPKAAAKPPLAKPAAPTKPAAAKSAADKPPAGKPAAGKPAPSKAGGVPKKVESTSSPGAEFEPSLRGSLSEGLFPDLAGLDASEPLLAASASGPLASAASPLDSPLAKPAAGKAAKKAEGPGLAKRLATSRGLWTALGGLAAVALVAAAAAWQAKQPTSEQVFEAARQDYESGALGPAAEKFAAFAARYPRHARADAARGLAALARLRSLAAGGNTAAVLSAAQEILADSGDLIRETKERRALAEVLSRLAGGLVEQAQAAVQERTLEAQSALDRAVAAVALCHRYLRPSLRAETGIDQSELAVARLVREQARDKALADALRKLTGSAAGDRACEVHRELVTRYPELAGNAQLTSAMAATAMAQRARVTHQPLGRAAETTEPPSPLVASLTVALRSATPPAADTVGTCCIWNEAEGAIYGIRAADGKLQWRRFIGFDASVDPLALPAPYAGDLLLVDAVRQELVRLQSADGRLTWRVSLPALPCGAVLLDEQVLVACRNGDLARIDVASGTLCSKFTLPQPLSTAPAVDAERGLIYQVADFGYLYVLTAEGKCAEVVYMGHEPGSIVVPPRLVGHRLVIAENNGLRYATLRVLEGDEQGIQLHVVQSLPLAAHVLTPVATTGDRLYIATLGGGLQSWSVAGSTTGQPLVAGPSIAPRRDISTVPWLTLVGDQLWMSGAGLSAFDLKGDTLTQRTLVAPSDIMVQPWQPYEERLVYAHRGPSWDGLTVSAIERTGEKEIWRTLLAAPTAGAPLIDRTSGSVVLAHRGGGVFLRSLDELCGSQALDEPTARIELPRALPRDTRTISWNDDLVVFAPGGADQDGADQLLVFDAARQPPVVNHVPLPSPLTCPPIAWGPYLLVATDEAQVYLLDPRSGLAASEPFQPPLVPGRLPRWEALLPLDDDSVLLCDLQGPVFRLTRSSDGQTKLLAKAVESSPLSSGRARRFLGGRSFLGGRWLAVDDERELLCFKEQTTKEPAWKVPLDHGLPVGMAVEEDRFVFTSATGEVWSIAAADGKELWAVPIDQPLVGDPVPSTRGWLLTGRDGTVFVLPSPQSNFAARQSGP